MSFCESATIQADSVNSRRDWLQRLASGPRCYERPLLGKVCNRFGRIRSNLRIGSKNNSCSRVLSG